MRLPKIVFSSSAKETVLKRLTILGLVLLIAAATTLSAITVKVIKTGTAFAGAKPQKTIIIDAGHGGFESNDRPTPMPLLSGGEYFYESEGNLDRAFHMQKFLEKKSI